MNFVRPEAQASLLRWREALVGLALVLLGSVWILARTAGILHWMGYIIAPVGALLIYAGVQRARFRQDGTGPGVVSVTEGQIAYFGPLDGGAMSVAGLTRLTLDPTGKPLHWILETRGQPALTIPSNAMDAEQLFDVFSALPGLDIEQILQLIETPPKAKTIVWQRKV